MPSLALRIRTVALEHDSAPAFHAAYLVFVFLAAALLNSGAFAVLVAAHISLDIVKYREVHRFPWARTLAATFRENLVDVALLVTALCFAVYFHHATSITAVSGALHVEQTIIRGLGMALPKMEVLFHNMRIMTGMREHLRDVRQGAIGRRYLFTEKLCVLALLAGIAALIAAPAILPNPDMVYRTFGDQLIPWRI